MMAVDPFLRWVGGKRWLTPQLGPILQSRLQGWYLEPFLGGGAVYFKVNPEKAVLSDINNELINTYRMVSQDSEAILSSLKKITVDADSYYRVRASKPRDRMSRAVRFLYLNRTCYGGLYRTNAQGVFNTPYGGGSRTPNILWERGLLGKAETFLGQESVRITAGDFEKTIAKAGRGDIVYCDPVYATENRTQYDRYNPELFGWPDQLRLREAVQRAFEKGAVVIICNAYSREIQKLYEQAIRIPVCRRGGVGAGREIRANRMEYVIILDPAKRRKDWAVLGEIERNRSIRASNESCLFRSDGWVAA